MYIIVLFITRHENSGMISTEMRHLSSHGWKMDWICIIIYLFS